MYHVKVVRSKNGHKQQRVYEACSEYTVTEYSNQTKIRLIRKVRPRSEVINLPDDGESVYITLSNGDNFDSYHYPPREIVKEFRA